jgi:hypothetical protein
MTSYLRLGIALGVLLAVAPVAQGQANIDCERFRREWPSLCKQLVEKANRANEQMRSITAHSPLSEATICECITARMRDDKYLKYLLDGDVNQARTIMQAQGFQPYLTGKLMAHAFACWAIELERSVDGLMPPGGPTESAATFKPSTPAAERPPASTMVTVARTVLSGERRWVGFHLELNPDCTPVGIPTIFVMTPPSHGTLSVEQGTAYPTFPKENQRYECNRQKALAALIYYQSSAGYAGPDTATIEVLLPSGFVRAYTYTFTVR